MVIQNVSLVMLLKDEEEHIDSQSQRTFSYFSHVILLDDGSADQTAIKVSQLVENAGTTTNIKVTIADFGCNFAAKRNHCQAISRTPWVFHLDADEAAPAELLKNLDRIAAYLEGIGCDVCGFPRWNYLDGVLANDVPRKMWSEACLRSLRGRNMSPPQNQDHQFRLLRSDVPWAGAIHERPLPVILGLTNCRVFSKYVLRHPKSLSEQSRRGARYGDCDIAVAV